MHDVLSGLSLFLTQAAVGIGTIPLACVQWDRFGRSMQRTDVDRRLFQNRNVGYALCRTKRALIYVIPLCPAPHNAPMVQKGALDSFRAGTFKNRI
jgi:hypothetical protein